MSLRRIITLTTDFGYEDPFVGVMKGVILKINPHAEIIDLCHGIIPYSIEGGAYSIGTSYSYFPENSIHVVVVDPSVGSLRRPIIVKADNHYFIGPDNGVFGHIYARCHNTPEVRHLTAGDYFLSSQSPTFQGRDVFAPVAAWLSKGIEMNKLGDPVTDYDTTYYPVPEITSEGVLKGMIIHKDRFGNAISNITGGDMEKLSGLRPNCRIRVFLKGKEVPLRVYYSQVGDRQWASLINSSGYLEFFVYQGNASSEYHISVGDPLTIDSY